MDDLDDELNAPRRTADADESLPSLGAAADAEDDAKDEAPSRASPIRLNTMPAEEAPREAEDESQAEPEPAASVTERPRSHRPSEGPGVLFTTESPILSVEATGPRKVLIGKEAQFVVKIRNMGAAANNVVVTVNIPNYADVVAANPTTGSAQTPGPGQQREPLEWKISRLEAKSEETLSLGLVPRKSSPMDLAVQWTFTPEASQTLVEVQEPKLAMTITGPDEVLFGQSRIYKLTVSNPGNGDTENVTVGLSPIGRSTEGAGNHRLGTLRAGESKSIDVELTARQAGVVTIKAQAFAEGGLRSEAVEQVLVRRESVDRS